MASSVAGYVALTVAGVSGLCAYTNHREYKAYGENLQLDSRAIANDARYAAEVAMRLQYSCLAKDPNDWCNRDLTFKDHYRISYRELATKHKYNYGIESTNRQNRNQWLLIFAVSALVAAYNLRSLLKA